MINRKSGSTLVEAMAMMGVVALVAIAAANTQSFLKRAFEIQKSVNLYTGMMGEKNKGGGPLQQFLEDELRMYIFGSMECTELSLAQNNSRGRPEFLMTGAPYDFLRINALEEQGRDSPVRRASMAFAPLLAADLSYLDTPKPFAGLDQHVAAREYCTGFVGNPIPLGLAAEALGDSIRFCLKITPDVHPSGGKTIFETNRILPVFAIVKARFFDHSVVPKIGMTCTDFVTRRNLAPETLQAEISYTLYWTDAINSQTENATFSRYESEDSVVFSVTQPRHHVAFLTDEYYSGIQLSSGDSKSVCADEAARSQITKDQVFLPLFCGNGVDGTCFQIKIRGPIDNVHGLRIAKDRRSLWFEHLERAIDHTQFGVPPTLALIVWTGFNGTSGSCLGGSGIVEDNDDIINPRWYSNATTSPCAQIGRVYCISQ